MVPTSRTPGASHDLECPLGQPQCESTVLGWKQKKHADPPHLRAVPSTSSGAMPVREPPRDQFSRMECARSPDSRAGPPGVHSRRGDSHPPQTEGTKEWIFSPALIPAKARAHGARATPQSLFEEVKPVRDGIYRTRSVTAAPVSFIWKNSVPR